MCRKKRVLEKEVQFFNYATKGEPKDSQTTRPLDRMWNECVNKDEIINARNDEGDRPLHVACYGGHREVVEWILNKPELNAKAYINDPDHRGLKPLFLVCLKGYVGVDGVGARMATVKDDRLKIVKMLKEAGANFDE